MSRDSPESVSYTHLDVYKRQPVDLVIVATPIDLAQLIDIDKPSQRVRYELQEIGQPTLTDLLRARFGR